MRMLCPNSIHTAYGLARMQEECNLVHRRGFRGAGNFSSSSSGGNTHSGNFSPSSSGGHTNSRGSKALVPVQKITP